MKHRKKYSLLVLLVLILIVAAVWVVTLNKSEGDVFSSDNNSYVLVIPLKNSEAEGKTKDEIISMLNKKAN